MENKPPVIKKLKKKPAYGEPLMPTRNMARRIGWGSAIFGVIAFGLLLFGALWDIQITNYESYQARAVSQQTRSVSLLPNRGTIYDANMSEIAVSETVETVCLAPKNMDEEKVDLVCRTLADILELDYSDVRLKASKRDSYYQVLKKKVGKDVTDKIRVFIDEENIDGIDFYPDSTRYYPYGEFASAVVGFTDADNNGVYGIEKYYDAVLSGQNGRIITARNADGKAMPFSYEQYYDSTDGSGLVLTIDHTVQNILMKYLENAAADNDALGATGIVMRVSDASVVAMGSWPEYDLNAPRTLPDTVQKAVDSLAEEEQNAAYLNSLYEMWANDCISVAYEPGSTFKTVTAAMAVEENLVKNNEYYVCNGYREIAKWKISCWKDSGHGSLTFTEGVMGSCNCVFMDVAGRIGYPTFYKYMNLFGLLQKTGIDLPGESSGYFYSEESFDDNLTNIAVASFGQRFKITPVQLVTTICGIANGGNMMKPHVVSAFTDEEGNITETVKPTLVRQIVSKTTSEEICRILELVVSKGTGGNAYVAGYRVGGKTGTSEKLDIGSGDEYIASFLGIAPCDNPEYAVLVLIDEPQGDRYQGGQIAAPVVGKIFAEILPYLGVTAVYTEEETKTLQIEVPNLVDMSLSSAETELKNIGLEYEVIGEGKTVTAQLPAKKNKISNQTKVKLYCGEEPDNSTAKVPSVIGLSYSSAVARLVNAGFYMQATGAVQAVAGASVIAAEQSIAKGEYAPIGTVIVVEFLDQNSANTGE